RILRRCRGSRDQQSVHVDREDPAHAARSQRSSLRHLETLQPTGQQMTSLDAPLAAIAVPSETEAEQATQTAIDLAACDWFKDAIIYQMHVKAFQDASGDGGGDFVGLMQRLDYVQELGVTAIWLLPFYPSPLRDDGYDISDYGQVHPSYGDLEAFRAFVAEAHRRDI